MRNGKQVVYGSSYDRGLEHLLKMWGEIKKQVPDAELRVFYGWDLFDKVHGDNPASQAWKEKMCQLMEQPGITHLGRISHGACTKEMEMAAIWAYPTSFGEISCITAMRAQAYGAIPVVVNYAALRETVQYGVKVEGDIYDQETKQEYLKELVSLLKDEKRQEEIREPMMKWAQEKFTWANVAKQWTEEFKGKPSLAKQVDELMDNQQPLKAWELVKDTDSPLKERVWLKVRHAFEPDTYKKYYQEELNEPADQYTDFTRVDEFVPRFKWLVKSLDKGVKTILDAGCADGALTLTLAKKGYKTTGLNLYRPSVNQATEKANRLGVDATFLHEDLREHKGKYDAVVLMEVLEHLPNPKEAIDHLMGLLNAGGSLFLSTPSPEHVGIELHLQNTNREHWDDGKVSGHLQLFSREDLEEMLKDYKVVQLTQDVEKSWLVEVKNG